MKGGKGGKETDSGEREEEEIERGAITLRHAVLEALGRLS